jgi:tetratricopeptide (TPR) repeat protein
MTLNNLGTVYCDLGDYAAAREYHQRAMELRLTIDDHWGEANSLTNLSLVNHGLGDDEAARRHGERALTIQQEIGDRHGEGYSLTYLGHALAGLSDWPAATAAYDKAMQLRRELGQPGLAIDDLAGLARVAFRQGNLETASAHVAEITAWVRANGMVGVEYPLEVYLTCYQILTALPTATPADHQQARTLLTTAYEALMKQADGISDKALRLSFLEKVKTNQAIVDAWQSHTQSSL